MRRGDSMRYWLEVRWPGSTCRLLEKLYFHRGKRKIAIAKRMSRGDPVLLYETQRHPDPERSQAGSQAIFAVGIVDGEIECLSHDDPDVSCEGGIRWDVTRAFALRPKGCLPLDQTSKGVPLCRVQSILGYSPSFTRLFTMEIKDPADFRTLEAELLKRIELATSQRCSEDGT